MNAQQQEVLDIEPTRRLRHIGARLTVLLALALGIALAPVLATSASATTAVPAPPVVIGPGPQTGGLSGNAPDTVVGASYSYKYASFMALPCTTITKGSLPPGLKFNGPTCTISGKPTTAGTYAFTVSATTRVAATKVSLADTIVVAARKTTITGDAPNGAPAIAYSFTYTTNSPKGCFALVFGSLPPGLTFNAASCTISGTPAQTGTYRFTVYTADFQASVTDTITIAFPTIITHPHP